MRPSDRPIGLTSKLVREVKKLEEEKEQLERCIKSAGESHPSGAADGSLIAPKRSRVEERS